MLDRETHLNNVFKIGMHAENMECVALWNASADADTRTSDAPAPPVCVGIAHGEPMFDIISRLVCRFDL